MRKDGQKTDSHTAGLESTWRGSHVTSVEELKESTSSTSHATSELLYDYEAAALLGVPVRKFHKLRKEAWMPQAIELSPRCLRWSRSELLAAVSDFAPRRRLLEEPPQLRDSRARRGRR